MSEPRAWAYKVTVELVTQEGEVIGTLTLQGGHHVAQQGSLLATGICNFGHDTPTEFADFFNMLAGDLRGARPIRLDG